MAEECEQQQAAAGARPFAGGPALVRLPAEIDLGNAALVTEQLRSAAGPGVAILIADMTGTLFCDCAGVSALLAASRDAARQGAELRIAARAAAVLRVFELTGVLDALRVDRSVAGAAADRQCGRLLTESDRQVRRLSCRRGTDAAESGPQPDPPRSP